jgi:hypothetical protein
VVSSSVSSAMPFSSGGFSKSNSSFGIAEVESWNGALYPNPCVAGPPLPVDLPAQSWRRISRARVAQVIGLLQLPAVI